MKSTLGLLAAVMVATVALAADKPQTKCPIQGEPINKKQFVDVKGYRIYVCCKGCIGKIKADPDKAIATIKANGEEPEKSPEPKK
jgi:hypothetical protein